MKNTHIAPLAACIAFCCLLLAGSNPVRCQSEVKFRMISGSLIILVPVTVDGQGPFSFIFDTGSDDVILDSSLARRLSLSGSGDTHGVTIAGAWAPVLSVAKSLQLGPVQTQNAPVLLTDLSGVRAWAPKVEGVLGQRFLSHFNYLLDYRNRSIRFEQSNEIQHSIHGEPMPLEIAGHRLLLLARTAGNLPLLLLLDSGANRLVLSRASADSAHLVVEGRRFEMTVNSKVALPFGRLEQLALGSRLLRNLPVTVTAAQQMERICDGLLPASLFKAIYVNNTEGVVEILDNIRRTH
jgi:predicted aspartyl protease